MLKEFERLAERGGVLGAMETGYQRGNIQDESLYYEHKKHDGSYPIIGVNTFLNPQPPAEPAVALQRSSDAGEAEPARPPARFPGPQRRRRPGDAGASAPRRHRQRERLRRADGGRALLLARPDHQRPLRRRRPLPQKHVGRKSGRGHIPCAGQMRVRDAGPELLFHRLSQQRVGEMTSDGLTFFVPEPHRRPGGRLALRSTMPF